jgi:L-fucose mutarotase
VLIGISPLLTGELLHHLDEMGHSDSVVIADAHFRSARLARRFVDIPIEGLPTMVAMIRTVLPLDDCPAVDLMQSSTNDIEAVQLAALAAAGVEREDARMLERFAFYDLASVAGRKSSSGEVRASRG